MYGHRIVEIFFSGTHFHCNRKPLDHFVGKIPCNVTPDYFFVLTGCNELDYRW